ncbi:helix-turn-helix domain-containing protein [Nonomuraea sp. NPDC049750]|uniref:TetR/AcrR family transcriptional regulator n=1 Tax=Nonomuraea sp. NPDC049750 TaxID=3154738 RepID=UPI0033CCD09F
MSTPQTRRKTRTDAERNRDRVLEAARALFAESGYDVQMSEIARAAGVGIGTLYRKFPTREALIEAIAEHRAADLIAAARRLADADDPAHGLAGFLRHVVRYWPTIAACPRSSRRPWARPSHGTRLGRRCSPSSRS